MTKEEFAALSWKILEAKVLYYKFPTLPNISDAEFDTLQQRYIQYCKDNKVKNTLIHNLSEDDIELIGDGMMEIDESRPSVKLVLSKFNKPI